MADSSPIVRFDHVSVRYPGALANDDVSLAIRRGEAFALVGENGAGKTTLMNVLYGLTRPTLGTVTIKGEAISARHDPMRAMAMGVGMVHQHFKLVPSFTVAQNIALGSEPVKNLVFYDHKKINSEVLALGKRFGLPVNPDDIVDDLSVGLQQRVEILKALHRGADILVLDEPTAVLSPGESDELFEVLRGIVLKQGMTVILITHKLHEVMQFSDRVGVMKQGRLEGIVNTAETDEHKLAAMMVGREVLFDELRTGRPTDREVLQLKDLRAQDDRGLPAVKGIDLTVHAGEIVGVCGVEGNGQTELTECIMGMRPQTGGEVYLSGQNISRLSPRQIRARGVSYIPADRMRTGLSAEATVMENLLVGKQRQKEFSRFGIQFRKRRANAYARELSEVFDIRAGGIDIPMKSLSGGNMQKAVIAREFSFDTPVLIINQPTRGVDIGAIEFIHEKILQKRAAGCAILLVSADLDELFRLSDRLVTLFEGQLTGQFQNGAIGKQEISYYMTGGRQEVQA
ncbi:MAG TPA: ABC transporter ATP-binding protein [Candidatus Limiplasma sp.]|nr:ABC transporter ATP-binding protein [Candidatus Limiplasma sp.]